MSNIVPGWNKGLKYNIEHGHAVNIHSANPTTLTDVLQVVSAILIIIAVCYLYGYCKDKFKLGKENKMLEAHNKQHREAYEKWHREKESLERERNEYNRAYKVAYDKAYAAAYKAEMDKLGD